MDPPNTVILIMETPQNGYPQFSETLCVQGCGTNVGVQPAELDVSRTYCTLLRMWKCHDRISKGSQQNGRLQVAEEVRNWHCQVKRVAL